MDEKVQGMEVQDNRDSVIPGPGRGRTDFFQSRPECRKIFSGMPP
jgi:hypothetical protein